MDIRPADVIVEFLQIIDDVNQGEHKNLENRIPDPSYLRNAVELAKAIAPDGKELSQVGFTASIDGTHRSVGFTRRRADITVEKKDPGNEDIERLDISGTLLYADATRDAGSTIKLVEGGGQEHKIVVPSGMMDDIVKPLWNTQVLARVKRRRGILILSDIDEA